MLVNKQITYLYLVSLGSLITYSWCFDTERDELSLPRDPLFLYCVLNHKWTQMVSYW